MAKAIAAKGVKLEIDTSSTNTPIWTKVGGLKDFSGLGGGTGSVIDISDLDSSAKEKMLGIVDEGQVSLSFNYDPTDTGQLAMEAARAAAALKSLRITTGTVTRTFSGYVMSFEVGGSVDQTISLSVNFEISGSIVKGTSV